MILGKAELILFGNGNSNTFYNEVRAFCEREELDPPEQESESMSYALNISTGQARRVSPHLLEEIPSLRSAYPIGHSFLINTPRQIRGLPVVIERSANNNGREEKSLKNLVPEGLI